VRSLARRRRPIALLAVLLPVVFVLSAAVQASASSELSIGEREAIATSKQTEHEQRAAEKHAAHEAEKAARKARREAVARERSERFEEKHPFGIATFSCSQVTWTYRSFPSLPGNTIGQQVTIDHDHTTRLHSTFTFDGSSGTTTTLLDRHAGRYQVDAWALWSTNGVKGHFDIRGKVSCPPEPAMSIEKLQRIGGSTATYASTTLTGAVGQTVEYEIIVKNTGNIPLTLGALGDPRCDAGTIAGTPPSPLVQGASATFTCTHVLTTADQVAGSYANTASETATPVGEGSPVSGETNTVVVEVSPPTEPPIEEPTTPPGGPGTPPSSGVLGFTSTPTPTGSSGSSSTSTSRSGVLAFKATSVPSLSSPRGCVRASFRVSLKAAGVRSVTFYMDGHKLRTLSARNARKGRLTLLIDPSQLSVGAHRLMARITMAPAARTAKAAHATRTSTVLRCRSAVLTPLFTG
jgi:hypothetical protein